MGMLSFSPPKLHAPWRQVSHIGASGVSQKHDPQHSSNAMQTESLDCQKRLRAESSNRLSSPSKPKDAESSLFIATLQTTAASRVHVIQLYTSNLGGALIFA